MSPIMAADIWREAGANERRQCEACQAVRGVRRGLCSHKHRRFLLELADNGRRVVLTLSANVLAIVRFCSQSWICAHALRQ